MEIEDAKREVSEHLDRQAAILRRYQYVSLVFAISAAAGFFLGYGPPAMFVFVVAFVYWRDTRNRQQSLENARVSFQANCAFAQAPKDLTNRFDAIAPREPQPTPMQSFLQRVDRARSSQRA